MAQEDHEASGRDAAALEQEVERLSAANAALQRRMSRRAGLRRAARIGLLVLGCLLAMLAAFALWTRLVLLDTDRYVATVAPLAERPDVQRAISDRLGDRIVSAVDLEGFARELLPPRAEPLAGPVATGVETVVRRQVSDFVASDTFAQVWDGANQRAHALVIGLVTGEQVRNLQLEGDTVTLDLAGAADAVATRLRDRGLDRLADRIPESAGAQVPILQSEALGSASRAVRVLKAISWVLPLLALLALAGYVALSDGVRRPLTRAALALALAMLLLLALIGLGRSAYLDALDSGTLPRQTMAGVFDTLVRFLRDGIRVAVLAAALVAAVAAFAGRPMERLAGSRPLRTSRAAAWVSAHRTALQLVAVAAGAVVLMTWSAPGARVVLIILATVGVIALLIGAIAREGDAPLPDTAAR